RHQLRADARLRRLGDLRVGRGDERHLRSAEGQLVALRPDTGGHGRAERAGRQLTLPSIVVAAAIVTGEPPRLLAAPRPRPHALAGLWELPGGKAEPGESDRAALARECREEL